MNTPLNPPPTGMVDRNGRIICYHDLVSTGLIDHTYYYVIDDPELGWAVAPVYQWTIEKLTPELARTMTVVKI